ncbi:hypothetical protein [Entomobacter blattae]|uniref:Uncharacterized protein n=1 Tax=Entomobacter blattae TaxID=2762277 RepID=A0A7H1NUJ6_9PROT|nr:hypothetical protein [Entomobacter blattae]QNT79456.1 hypothetical protein JGUZn3_22550 [Entomobacter blattae]
MELLISANSVPLERADKAPIGGIPQYATSGDPILNIAPTVIPAWHYNMLTAEVYYVIKQAGLVPDRNDWTQLDQALAKKYATLEYINEQNKNAVTSTGFASVDLETGYGGAVFKTRDGGKSYAFPQSALPSPTQLGINALAFNIAAQQLVVADTNNNFHYYYSTNQIDDLLNKKADLSFLNRNFVSGQNTGVNVSITRIELAGSTNGGDDTASAYINVSTDTGKLVSVPTNANVARQITDYAQPKGDYQPAGNYQPKGNYVTQEQYKEDFDSGDTRVATFAYGHEIMFFKTNAVKEGERITFPRAFAVGTTPVVVITPVQGSDERKIWSSVYNITNDGFNISGQFLSHGNIHPIDDGDFQAVFNVMAAGVK